MKKFVPFIVLSLFVILLLSLCGPILTKRQQEEAQRAYEAERHLVVFSDLPQDVNDGLAQLFYDRNICASRFIPRATAISARP